jgi:hypothetical protein
LNDFLFDLGRTLICMKSHKGKMKRHLDMMESMLRWDRGSSTNENYIDEVHRLRALADVAVPASAETDGLGRAYSALVTRVMHQIPTERRRFLIAGHYVQTCLLSNCDQASGLDRQELQDQFESAVSRSESRPKQYITLPRASCLQHARNYQTRRISRSTMLSRAKSDCLWQKEFDNTKGECEIMDECGDIAPPDTADAQWNWNP